MKTHLMSHTHFYKKWEALQNRCHNSTFHAYSRYGGRGIKCLWKSFEEFKENMYPNYLKHCKKLGIKDTTLERINNNGNYSKQNCRWATRKEQQNHTSRSRYLTFNGKTLTISQWAEKTGIKQRAIWKRIYLHKWSISKALTSPLKT